MIIALAGKKHSGKTALAQVLEMQGFKRISFAGPLKKLVAEMVCVKPDQINDLKEIPHEYKFGHAINVLVSDATGIPIREIPKELCEKTFHSVREILQYVGTEVIRAYDEDWHVNKLKETIINNPNCNFVVDDVRFSNEKSMLESLGAELWYVVRPYFTMWNRHESEMSMDWRRFKNIVVNNGSLDNLLERWGRFMLNHDEYIEKKKSLDEICRNGGYHSWFYEIFMSRLLKKYFVYPNMYKFDILIPDTRLEFGDAIATNVDNNMVRILKRNGKVINITEPLLIEDFR